MKLKKKIVCSLILIAILFSTGKVLANTEFTSVLGEMEYTEEFKKWLESSDEEKSKSMIPRSYKIPEITYEYTNPIKIAMSNGYSMLNLVNFKIYNPISEIIKETKTKLACAFKYPPRLSIRPFK